MHHDVPVCHGLTYIKRGIPIALLPHLRPARSSLRVGRREQGDGRACAALPVHFFGISEYSRAHAQMQK